MKTISTFLAVSAMLCFFSFYHVAGTLHDYFFGQNKKPAQAESVSSVAAADNVNIIVAAAEAFKATLDQAQIDSLQYTFDTALAQSWSNLPCGNTCRVGVSLGSLDSAQFAAAQYLLSVAAGTAANEGYDEFFQVVTADSILATASGSTGGGPGGGPGGGTPPGGSGGPGGRIANSGTAANVGSGNTQGYGKGLYYISFLNEPSATGAWMMQFGGHHYAANIAFNNGLVVGATPHFLGIEPKYYTVNGVLKAPLLEEHAYMVNMLSSLTTAEQEIAKITNETFSDVSLGPGEDGNFPSTHTGLRVGTLTDAQKALVKAAIEPWIEDADDATADSFRTIYASELDSTYIAYTGSTTNLDSNTNYVRIDGPSVWIEFICQTGVVYRDSIHYHSVWRDRKRDYGNYLQATALPVHLTSFTGSVQGNVRVLNWATSNEVNTSFFSIERSLNPSQGFASLGQVSARNGSLNNYTFTDKEQVAEGTYYYRLKIADKDGTTKYSQVVPLKTGTVKNLTIYPNPATDKITVSAVNGLSDATIKIVNGSGKVVVIKSNVSGKQTDMNVSHLAAGIYVVQVQSGSSLTTYKFVKQNK